MVLGTLAPAMGAHAATGLNQSEIALKTKPKSDLAVLLVDLQACFVQGGSLEVPGANESYVREVEGAMRWLFSNKLTLLASRDYHPEGHISFASSHPGTLPFDVISLGDGRSQTLWPDHCVQTRGDSRLMIDQNLFFETIKKGQNPEYDSNSAFEDDAGHKTELNALLHRQGIKTLVIFGLATEVCVSATIRHAVAAGYRVVFVQDLSRGLTPDGVQKAMDQMKILGVETLRDTRELKRFVSRYLSESR